MNYSRIQINYQRVKLNSGSYETDIIMTFNVINVKNNNLLISSLFSKFSALSRYKKHVTYRPGTGIGGRYIPIS